MTKIKNTKKGMAKKTLSMSLVVAMLATSNVPVWAAEFSDGTDAAVETEAPAAETFSDDANAAPVVEDTTADTATATSVSVNAEIKESGWGSNATVDLKSFAPGALQSYDNIEYIWKVNGLEVAKGTVKATSAALGGLTYEPSKADCGGELQLFLSYTDSNTENSDKNFSWESNKVTVSKRNINTMGYNIEMKTAGPAYDGKSHNDASEWVKNYNDLIAAGLDVSIITDKDFVNADSHITAKITQKDTTYYQGEMTSTTSLSLSKSTATDKLKVEYVGPEYTYTGKEIKLKATDFKLTDTLSGEVLDSSKYIDIDHSHAYAATDAGEYTATIVTKNLVNYSTTAQNVVSENKWKINKLDISKCNIFLGEISEKATPILASDITKITVSDGTNTVLNDVAISSTDFVIGNVQENTGSVGTYTATVQTKATSRNYTGTSTTASFRVVRNALNNATFDGTVDGAVYATKNETYTGEAIVKDVKKLGNLVILDGSKKVTLTAGVDYDANFEYSNNVNAGTASITVTGKGSFEGSKKTFNFTITPATITNVGEMVSDKVGFVEDSTRKAEDYKSDIKVALKAQNANKKEFTLVEGTDYKVKYSFKDVVAGNIKTNKIVVKITLLNNNFGTKGTEYSEEVSLSKKQISNVTVTPVQSSYIYTGAAIVPELIVKDGETELSKDEDYVIKSVSNNKNVGTATVTIAGKGDYDEDSTAKATFTITAANTSDLVVNVADQDYDGTKKKPTTFTSIKLNGVDITDKFIISYPTSSEANRQVGTGTLTLTPDNGNKNFTGTKEVTFNIVGKKLPIQNDSLKLYNADGSLVSASQKVFTYDGTEHTFAKAVATIFDGSKKLVEGTDYEIKYFHNVSGADESGNHLATGTAYVAVVGKGNYSGNGTVSLTDENGKTVNYIAVQKFTINRLTLVPQCVTVKDAEYAEGLAVKPQITVAYGGNVLTEDKDYKIVSPTVATIIPNKTYSSTVTGINGYYGNVSSVTWKVTKKDLANCDVTAAKDANGTLSVVVMNGSVKVPAEKYVVTENADGTVTVTPAKDSKYYTGSKTVTLTGSEANEKPGTPMISNVKVVGNKATVILSGDTDGAAGYDYVISTDRDCITNKDYTSVNKNQVQTSTTFKYVQQGTYYAYCHAWKRDENGKKVFSDWSNAYPFVVSAITPDAPVITNVKVSGSTIKVTYKAAANATGYDVVLGTSSKKENGETRPYNYGAHKVLNLKEGTVTATFKNVPAGKWTVGMHAFNRTSEDGKKVFSPWSNLKTATVK